MRTKECVIRYYGITEERFETIYANFSQVLRRDARHCNWNREFDSMGILSLEEISAGLNDRGRAILNRVIVRLELMRREGFLEVKAD